MARAYGVTKRFITPPRPPPNRSILICHVNGEGEREYGGMSENNAYAGRPHMPSHARGTRPYAAPRWGKVGVGGVMAR